MDNDYKLTNHSFSQSFSLKPIKEVEKYQKYLNKCYLGFIVVRPIPEAVIGRTVLDLYEDTITSGEYDEGSRTIRCVRNYSVSLFGYRLSLLSLGFQEQDTVIAACATSALWSTLEKTANYFKMYVPTNYEITQGATQFISMYRSIPSHGLTTHQITQAIRSFGLEPDVKQIINPNTEKIQIPFLMYCYSYLRSGIPILLGVCDKEGNLHAQAVLGYSLSDKLELENEMTIIDPLYSILEFRGSKITKFYIHDDQVGPFARFIVQPGENACPVLKTNFEGLSDIHDRTYYPLTAIIPIYHKIRVPVNTLLDPISRLTVVLNFSDLLPDISDPRIIWDSYLSNIQDYKNSILRDKDIKDKEKILTQYFPRFFWRFIAEIGSKRVFELLADATDMERSFQYFRINFYNDNFRKELRKVLYGDEIKLYLSNPMIKLLKTYT